MARAGWPARARHGPVEIRPLRRSDSAAWREVRLANERWLLPWEPSSPLTWHDRNSPAAFGSMVRALRGQARAGVTLPFVITYEDRLAGQLTIGNIVRGSFQAGYAGYWVDGRLAGRGIMPTALALAVDHCFGPAGMHRVEVNIRPENTPSRRVVEKLGFREEGFHERLLFIDGAWRDHVGYALTTEEVPRGLLTRWLASRHTG
ncbi:MAG: alanine acetyltransferase [Pseudonocardiales bacterium]|nr:MAG: alanine acetyltransferase [Pseudonocardiales bacterium]